MNIILSVVMGLLGLATGIFIVPLLAQKTVKYKCAKKNIEVPEDARYTGILSKTVISVFNMIGWSLAGFFTGTVLSAVLISLIWTFSLLFTWIDLRIHMIPNEYVLILMLLGIVFQLDYFGVHSLLSGVISMIAVMGVFIFLAKIMGLHTIGAGDVKLAGAMGLTLGYPFIVYSLVIMGVLFAVFCGVGILMKKITLKSSLPFAPFMMAGMVGTVIAVLLKL